MNASCLRLVSATASGGLFALAFFPGSGALGLPCGLFGTALFLATASRARGAAAAGACGFLFGLAAYGAGLSWVWHSIHYYGGLPAPLALAALLALGAVNALFPAAAAAAASLIPSPALRCAAGLPALLLIADWIRGEAVNSFPWISLGYALSDTPLAGFAPLAGAYGVELAALLILGCLAAAVSRQSPKGRLGCLAAAAALAAAGCLADGLTWSQPSGEVLRVRLVQPDLPVAGVPGAPPLSLGARVSKALALSGDDPRGTLVVWPESVVAAPLERIPPAQLERLFESFAERGESLAFNAFSESARGEISNSLFLFSAARGLQRYDKRHLVPFGEYVPAGFHWLVDALGIPMSDQQPGAASQPAFRLGGMVIAPMICYENLFGAELREFWRAAPGPGLLLVSSNLSWFSPSIQFQHLQFSRMRARETARPLVSVNNNGSSALVGSRGEILLEAGPGAASLAVSVSPALGPETPYVRFGSLPAALAALGLALWLALRERFRKNKKTASL